MLEKGQLGADKFTLKGLSKQASSIKIAWSS